MNQYKKQVFAKYIGNDTRTNKDLKFNSMYQVCYIWYMEDTKHGSVKLEMNGRAYPASFFRLYTEDGEAVSLSDFGRGMTEVFVRPLTAKADQTIKPGAFHMPSPGDDGAFINEDKSWNIIMEMSQYIEWSFETSDCGQFSNDDLLKIVKSGIEYYDYYVDATHDLTDLLEDALHIIIHANNDCTYYADYQLTADEKSVILDYVKSLPIDLHDDEE